MAQRPTIERLLEGFRSFRRGYYREQEAMFKELARDGQAPRVMMISCCDSRVDPLLVTGAQPGDIFILRNVANLVPPYHPTGSSHGTSAALEFAVKGLEVEQIVVMGHAQCGGVHALLEEPALAKDSDFIAPWMANAVRARARSAEEKSPEARQRRAEQETVRLSLDNLMTFPWIAERVRAGRLSLHGWYFEFGEGRLMALDPESGSFKAVDGAESS